jgi:ADP-heptose:LPS heptosyltransferase
LAGLEGVAACHARGEMLPAYDVHCPLGSLPLALKTEPGNIPADIPYLRADEASLAKWRARIEALPGKRVALAWAGNVSHANDRNRSIDLKLLEPLLAQGGVSFLSIQRELRGNDAELLARHGNVSQLGHELADMADTAAVAVLADLTISVDTSVVHLAGALGRPVWVMLPFAPDWRWTPARDPEKWEPVFGKDHAQTKETGEHSPWYPQARLLRQPTLGDWPSVIATLRAELARFVAA